MSFKRFSDNWQEGVIIFTLQLCVFFEKAWLKRCFLFRLSNNRKIKLEVNPIVKKNPSAMKTNPPEPLAQIQIQEAFTSPVVLNPAARSFLKKYLFQGFTPGQLN